ncbi:response regulator [Aliarcobacter skirrowii]|uniref:response regulator n=1 Tax=Aliarcobacter skirrowii TaxID=28200 RepID=UPI0029A9E212|nr:response regulator [Aliarcobacter skirrowii]MDX4036425.1 response regulator [Aliarcobacter skirrowii]
MKILLIEDDDEKRERITDFLKLHYKPEIVFKKSFHSGLKELVSLSNYDCVLLDMSMPSFDITSDDSEGGSPESFAGRKLLEQMKFRFIKYPTIIITQFDSFGEYTEKRSLEELKNELSKKYSPIYVATVYYSASENDWQKTLKEIIDTVLKDKND